VQRERREVQQQRRSIGLLLREFKSAVESRAVASFWQSRAAGRLHQRPEETAQALLAVFFKGVLRDGGYVLRELESGTGYVDLSILLARTLHLVEMKVLRGALQGAAQLAVYMRQEGRREGWLVVIDARKPGSKQPLPDQVRTTAGIVRVIVVDINPLAPSRRRF
jgi:hypothetical protein